MPYIEPVVKWKDEPTTLADLFKLLEPHLPVKKYGNSTFTMPRFEWFVGQKTIVTVNPLRDKLIWTQHEGGSEGWLVRGLFILPPRADFDQRYIGFANGKHFNGPDFGWNAVRWLDAITNGGNGLEQFQIDALKAQLTDERFD